MHPVLPFIWRVIKYGLTAYIRLLIFSIPTFILVVLTIKGSAYLAEKGYIPLIHTETIISGVSIILLIINLFILIKRPRTPILKNWSALADQIPSPKTINHQP